MAPEMRLILLLMLVLAAYGEILERKRAVDRVAPASTTPCSFAENVIGLVQSQIKEGHGGREKLGNMVKAVCRMVTTDSCRSLVENLDNIMQWTSDESSSRQIAEKLSLCPHQLRNVQSPQQGPGVSPECTACKALMTIVYYQVKFANKTIEFIEKEIRELCELLKSEVCEIVLKDLDKIIQMILDGLTPEKICEKLGFCTPSEDKIRKKVLSDSVLCEACEDIVELIHYEIKYANATVAMVEDIIELLCNATHSQVCETILHDLDSIIQWIEDGLDPTGICQKIHFCPQRISNPTSKPESPKLKDECTVCKVVMQLLKENAPEAEIKATVELTCRLLGEEFRAECDHIIGKLDSIMADLQHKSLDAECKSLGYCYPKMKVGVDWCEQCKIFTAFVESQIKLSNASIHIIMDIAKRICEIFGSEEEKLCDIVIKNLLRFSEMIMEGLEPKKICEELGLCPSKHANTLTDESALVV